MSYSITQFENNLTNNLAALDNNFTTFGALVPIPCGVSGTNSLVLTQNATGLVPTPTITGYSTEMLFTGIAAATNTGPVTATIGSTGVLNVYKDTAAGPVVLSSGEIVGGCAFTLRYDAALTSGAGGFHLASSTTTVIGGGATLTNQVSGAVSLSFTATPGWQSQDQPFTLTGVLPTLPAVGDFVQVNPPSLGASGVGYAGYVLSVGSLSSVSTVATVMIRQINAASTSLGANSGSYRYLVTRAVP